MKRIKLSARFGLSVLILAISGSAVAEKMDLDTHTAVIERLDSIVRRLDDSDASKIPSALRLADLLAERSRLKALKEVEQNCNDCLKSRADRRQALNYYIYVVPLLSGPQKSNALMQKAHLHYGLGEVKETEAIYKQIINDKKNLHSAAIRGQAHAALGDVYFQRAEFKQAKAEYDKALGIAQTPQRGLVYYRLSWCQFNLDQIAKAIATLEMILQTQKLTEMETAQGPKQDESFKIDVSKDLATFYARTQINRKTIDKLVRLSPQSHRANNLFFLGTEADRLGKKKESALVWMVYLETNGKDKDALEAQIRLARLKRDMGDVKGALATFSHVIELWKDPGCADKCAEYQSQLRKWITDWNREEKKTQTLELTHGYIMYTNLFTEDAEMFALGAEVAKQRKQYRQALDLYHNASLSSRTKLDNAKKLSAEELQSMKDIFENSLIGEIDMAETLKSHELRLKAYQHYLAMNPNGSRQFEVRYQIAQNEFEQKHFDKSADLFRQLALEKAKASRSLQKTAASMSIESCIRLKKEAELESWSLDYAKAFPEAKAEFYKIHRKTVLNSVASRINAKTADSGDMKRLDSVSLVGAISQDHISLNKSRYLLALRLEKFADAKKANTNLLVIKDLSAADRRDAQNNRIWLAELELDFKAAYRYTLDEQGKMTGERALRLIYLSQMAGLSSEKHENDFLKLSENRQARATVISARTKRSRTPDKELKKHIKELAESPETLAKITLDVYGRTKKREVLEKSFEFPSVRRAPTGAIIGRLIEYKFLDAELNRLAKSRLKSNSDQALKASLDERLRLFRDLEKTGQRAITNKDLVLQAIVLNSLKRENERLYNDILKLPVPRALKGDQRQQYQALLAEQAAPYKAKAEQILVTMHELWTNTSWSDQLAQNYEDARPEYKFALRQDIQQLAPHCPESSRRQFEKSLAAASKTPSDKSVSEARSQVRKFPFDPDYVKDLKDLETARGNDLVAAHLEARLVQMKGLLK